MTKNKAKTSDHTQKKNAAHEQAPTSKNAKSKQGYEHSYYDQDLEHENQNSSFGQGSQDALRHEMNHPENHKHEHQGRNEDPKQRNNLNKTHEKKYKSENEQNIYESENFIEDFENPYREHSHRKPSSMYQDENYSQPGRRWDDDFDEDNFYRSTLYHHEDDENLNIHHRAPK